MADIPKTEIADLLRKIREQYESLKTSDSSDNPDLDDHYPEVPPTPLNTELGFCEGGSITPYLGRGWGEPEETRIWSIGKECELILNFKELQNDLLLLFKGEYFKPKGLKGTPIELSLNGKIVASWDENHDSNLSTLILQNQLSESGKARLVFHFENPRSPASLNLSSDSRLLGFSFRSMLVKEI